MLAAPWIACKPLLWAWTAPMNPPEKAAATANAAVPGRNPATAGLAEKDNAGPRR
jgi:hypothetical protein